MIILGVDPGTAITGYGVIRADNNKHTVLGYGAIRTTPQQNTAVRLEEIYAGMRQLIAEFKPNSVAIEDLFFNRNVASAFAVGQARGVAMLAAAHCGLSITEYTPLQVKMAVTGYGRASKEQVAYMVRVLLGLAEAPKPNDITDALAISLCHSYNSHNWGGLQ